MPFTMHSETIYTKTAKGVLEVRNKSIRLPRDLRLVFLAVDGKSKAGELAKTSGLSDEAVAVAVNRLVGDGYVRIFSDGAQTSTAATAAADDDDEDLDLDFTSPAKVAELNYEAEQRARAEAEAKAR